MPIQMIVEPYNREKAVEYAYEWAYFRNPAYYDFSALGGNCTNFASQCLYAGSGVMNYTPVYGWYYIGVNQRAPAWTGVEYLYNFLIDNRGAGPFGREAAMDEIEPGDLCQLKFEPGPFQHNPVIVRVQEPVSPDNILIAANSDDSNCRPLSSYAYTEMRFIHIEGVRRLVRF